MENLNKEYLAEVFKRAKEVAIAICGWDERNLRSVQIDDDGSISVYFLISYNGGDFDDHTEYLSDADFNDPIEETVARYKKERQDEADKKLQEKLNEEKKEKIAKDKAERTTYERLKAKFES